MTEQEKAALVERCKTISAWREKYGPEHNVMLPAVEAEQIASIALSALQADGALTVEGTTPPTPADSDMIYAINRLLDSDGYRGTFSAIRRGLALEEVERLLDAAAGSAGAGS